MLEATYASEVVLKKMWRQTSGMHLLGRKMRSSLVQLGQRASDHSIFPTDSHHFHLYWGDDREALLDEVTNWPTYYPADLNAEAIAREMISH